MIPSSRPQLPKQTAERYLLINGVDIRRDVALLGIRGYYLDSMGARAKNDIGIYDDAFFIVGPEVYVSFNANTDPSRHRHGIATLLPGVYPYRKGRHGISRGPGYPALRPATTGERLPVSRIGEARVPSARAGVAINIHKGSRNSTSSEGCQTIHPSQWESFIFTVYDQMKRHNQTRIQYCLLEETAIRAGRIKLKNESNT
jgi:lysozyme